MLPLLAVTGLSLKLRLAPRSGTGEGNAFTGGDDSRLLTGLRQQTGAFFASCKAASLPDEVGIASRHNRSAITSDSEDGGPLTGNAVFISDQRVLDSSVQQLFDHRDSESSSDDVM